MQNKLRWNSVHYHSTTDDGSPLKTHRFYGVLPTPYDPHACHEAVTSPTRKLPRKVTMDTPPETTSIRPAFYAGLSDG